MSVNGDLVLESLHRVAERVEDPAPAVYARLFAQHPELEELFVLDPVGAVRRNMLLVAIECLMDHLADRRSSSTMMISERTNHAHLGVGAQTFDDFFLAVRDAFADLLGADWTARTHAAWTETIASLTASREFAPSPGN